MPLHLIAQESGETEQAMARLLAGRPELWEQHGGWLASLHPAAYEEARDMAKQSKQFRTPEMTPVVRALGIEWLFEHVGPEKLIELLNDRP